MQVNQNISLKPYNTFGIDVSAKLFSAFQSEEVLKELLEQFSTEKRLILGGGSNVLLTKNFDGIVLKNELQGIELVAEDEIFFYIRAGAGVVWHQLVLHCLENNYAGLENLALIPGSVGASPMQNIGAYGVEIKDVFYELQALNVEDLSLQTFSATACAFGYRESVFKRELRDKMVILNVTYRLRKMPEFHIQYGAIQQELENLGVQDLSIQSIAQAVMNIRRSKLPDPAVIGNAGSFFKNPEVSAQKFDDMKNDFPSIVGYPLANGNVKLAAGWLIEQAGWKGFRNGDAGCHSKQALVLVNYGHASGNEILQLSNEIILSINEKFGVELEGEVNVV